VNKGKKAEAAKDLFAPLVCDKDPHLCVIAPPARVCYRRHKHSALRSEGERGSDEALHH